LRDLARRLQHVRANARIAHEQQRMCARYAMRGLIGNFDHAFERTHRGDERTLLIQRASFDQLQLAQQVERFGRRHPRFHDGNPSIDDADGILPRRSGRKGDARFKIRGSGLAPTPQFQEMFRQAHFRARVFAKF